MSCLKTNNFLVFIDSIRQSAFICATLIALYNNIVKKVEYVEVHTFDR